MYFYPIKFQEIFTGEFQRYPMRNVFCRWDELMVPMHHKFVPRR